MDSKDTIRDTESGYDKLILTWRVSTFIALPSDHEPVRTIREELYSNDFRTDRNIKNYWSIPERLVDMRWLMDRQRERVSDGGKDDFASYIELEYRLYRTVIILGSWAGSCGKSIEQLNKDRDIQEEELLKRWQKDIPFLLECSSEREDALPFFEENLNRLLEMAEAFSELQITDARKRNLQRSAKSLLQSLQQESDKNLGEHLSLNLLNSEEQREAIALAEDFCKKSHDFLVNHAWREENSATHKLQELELRIQRVHADWSPNGADRWSEQYQRSLWEGLQLLADNVCEVINGTQDGPIASIEGLLKRAEEAIQLLQIKPKEKTLLHDNYIKDKNRCIALLDIENGPKVMAFSGFWDCEDRPAQVALRCNAFALKSFQDISRYLNTDLAIFSKGVVNRIIRCEINKRLRITTSGPMRNELPPAFEETQASRLKSAYSCCERKILAHLAAYSSVKPHRAATLYVKFQPCLSCYGALTNWIHANSIKFDIDYPDM